MVRELLAAGITPDALVGVSAGALNATFVAGTPLDRAGEGLVEVWYEVAKNGIFNAGSPKRLWAVLRQRNSLDPGTKLAAIVEKHCPVADLSDTALPVLVGTLDIDHNEIAWHDSGLAVPRLMASAAIPGVFPPVVLDGSTHVDGGVYAPVPLSGALRFAPTRLIVLDVSGMDQPLPPNPKSGMASSVTPSSALGILLASLEALRHRSMDCEKAMVPSSVEVFTIHGGFAGGMLPETASQIPQIIEAGAAAARELIARHPELTADLV